MQVPTTREGSTSASQSKLQAQAQRHRRSIWQNVDLKGVVTGQKLEKQYYWMLHCLQNPEWDTYLIKKEGEKITDLLFLRNSWIFKDVHVFLHIFVVLFFFAFKQIFLTKYHLCSAEIKPYFYSKWSSQNQNHQIHLKAALFHRTGVMKSICGFRLFPRLIVKPWFSE